MFVFKPTTIVCLLGLLVTTQTSCQQHKKDGIPQPIGYVSDFENIFTKSQRSYLDSMIGVYEKKTTVQIAVVTIDTSIVSKKDFDDYLLKIAKTWGVGQKDKNNGIVIGISKGYRHMCIQNGYGIENILTDSETKGIIDTAFIPSFKKEQYFEGVINGLKAIMKKLE